jgi:hypothetical protein
VAILAVDEVWLREPRLLVPNLLPLANPRIDWQNSITRDLVICFLPGMLYEAVSQKTGGGYEASGSRNATVAGLGCESTATSNGGAWFPYQPSWQRLANTQHTQLIRTRIDSVSSWSKLCCIPFGTGSWGSPYHSLAMGFFSLPTDFRAYENNAGAQVITTTTGLAATNVVSNYVARRDGSTASFFVDAKNAVSGDSAGTQPAIITVGAALSVLNRSHTDLNEGTDGHATMVCHWARALTDGEIVSLSIDPYQFLLPA